MAVAAKNYLTLVQDTLSQAGIQQTAPTDVTDTDGRTAEVARWVRDAWNEIASSKKGEWKWRKKRDEIQLTSGSDTATAPTGLERYDFQMDHLSRPFFWMRDLEVSLNTESTESQFKIYYIPWEAWRGRETDLVTRDSGQPSKFTVIPDTGTIQFDTTADQNYGLHVHYIDEITELTGNSSTPDLPPEYQNIIIWKALIDYADWDEAERRWKKANRRFIGYLRRMMIEQLDEMKMRPYSLYHNDR